MQTHFIAQYRGRAIGYYKHEDTARALADAFGADGSVLEVEGPCPSNAELAANDNYPKAPRLRVVASKAALLAPAKAVRNPVFEARALRLVRGGK